MFGLLAGLNTIVLVAWFWWSAPRFDADAYHQALTDSTYAGRLEHFPAFPDVKLRPLWFAHRPASSEESGHLQVLCSTANTELIWGPWEPRFAYTHPGIGMRMLVDEQDPRRVHPLVAALEFGERQELGPDWVIGVISARPGPGHTIVPWGHGDTGGIAVNRFRGLVLFWVETW